MFNFLNKTLASIFGGNKSERDVSVISPQVKEINAFFEQFNSLSNDELRAKSLELRHRIADHLSNYTEEMANQRTKVDTELELTSAEKEAIFKQIETLEKERNKELEKYLLEILPEAFGLMKQTAKRFTENAEIEVTATERDKFLAAQKKDFLTVIGNKAIYKNNWTAAKVPIKWEMVHYDVQLIGGYVLHQGKIAEMATGEGKTLVSTLPAYLNALSGFGVHIVTVNDYLARRDCEWNGPVYEFLNVSVDCIEYHEPNSDERKNAYMADITYGTNNEFGFDYLRDNMARTPDEIVQRGHHFAMVDEVDSVLIDDARTPLIISGPTPRGDEQEFTAMKPRVDKLVSVQRLEVTKMLARLKELLKNGTSGLSKEQDKEAGLLIMRCYRGLPKTSAFIKFLSEPGMRAYLLKSESYYLQEQQKYMPEVDKELYFVIEEKNKQVDLTDKGINLITTNSEDPEFFIIPDVGAKIAEIEKSISDPTERLHRKDEIMTDFSQKSERIHTIQQLLKAYALFENDVDYIVADNKVMIVDEQTGRVLDGRRYSDGLHQAIEAKENVKVEAATQTYATVTLQNFFRMYHKLCGMTGTAETEAKELDDIYKLDVVVIPTNRDIIRDDKQDLIYKTKKEKYNAVIEEIIQLTGQGRPILVGTTSVEISELLSKLLSLRKIPHNVLNAKQHQREAEIVAEAGFSSKVTIATNMAGRGTDIKLTPEVKAAGGLAIIGTERHESRRVDRQLRGRAGRQGDPGSSQFYVSLEDDLMRLFGSERMSGVMDKLGHKEGDVIQHSMITKSIENAQKKVELNNFGRRKRLLEYDDVMNNQREVIYRRRRNALFGDRLEVDIKNMVEDLIYSFVPQFHVNNDFEGLQLEVLRLFACEVPFDEATFASNKVGDIANSLFDHVYAHYKDKVNQLALESVPIVEQIYNEQRNKVENLVIPFTDGHKFMQVIVPLEETFLQKGKNIFKEYEKGVSLSIIDDEWKEHLRELDDLRQSVQNVQYAQKDPLMIYKKESFELFEQMLDRIMRETLSTLFKGHIYIEQDDENTNQRTQKNKVKPNNNQKAPKLSTSRADIYSESVQSAEEIEFEENENGGNRGRTAPEPVQKVEPVRVGLKVGRNDPCPCGSGKKFKNCHGQNE